MLSWGQTPALQHRGDLRKVSPMEQGLGTISPPPKCLKLMLAQLQEAELP